MKISKKKTSIDNQSIKLLKAQIPKDQLVKIKGGIVGADDIIDI